MQEIYDVPLMGGPHDGAFDDAVIEDGELCGKFYFAELAPDYCHVYDLIYNLDDGFRFIYLGMQPFKEQENGRYTVGEDDVG